MGILFAISSVEHWTLNPNRGRVWAPLTVVLQSCVLRHKRVLESSVTTKQDTYRLACDPERRPPNNAMETDALRGKAMVVFFMADSSWMFGFLRTVRRSLVIASDQEESISSMQPPIGASVS